MRFFILPALASLTISFSAPVSANATKIPTPLTEFSHVGDLDLSCGALSAEAAKMRDVILGEESVENAAKMRGHGVNAAAGIGSLIIGTVTGGIGFAAAGLIAAEAIDGNAQEARELKLIAAQRHSFMIGIYKAKACVGPVEHLQLQQPKPKPKATYTANRSDTPANYNNLSPAAGLIRSANLTHND